MKIAVYGSAGEGVTPETVESSHALGAAIARRGHTLITGACTGLPHEAALGAKSVNGHVIGFSPAPDLDKHRAYGLPTDGYDEWVFMPRDYKWIENLWVCYKYRNLSSAAECDAAVVVSGRIGTLNEYTAAYDLVKPIGALLGTGGLADYIPELSERIKKEPTPFITWSADIEELIGTLERAFETEKPRRLA
jgi:predicted Rossmann-fold nucleotide-binding protein